MCIYCSSTYRLIICIFFWRQSCNYVLSLEAWRLRPDRDTGMMKLGDVLKLASQFLDGSLERLFVKTKVSSSSSSSSKPRLWRVDVDLSFGCSHTKCMFLPCWLDIVGCLVWARTSARLPELSFPAHRLMLPHFAESLRHLWRLGGGMMDDGEVDSQPWPQPEHFFCDVLFRALDSWCSFSCPIWCWVHCWEPAVFVCVR